MNWTVAFMFHVYLTTRIHCRRKIAALPLFRLSLCFHVYNHCSHFPHFAFPPRTPLLPLSLCYSSCLPHVLSLSFSSHPVCLCSVSPALLFLFFFCFLIRLLSYTVYLAIHPTPRVFCFQPASGRRGVLIHLRARDFDIPGC